MKNVKNLSIMLVVAAMAWAFSSCKKDSDGTDGNTLGNYEYQGKTVTINSGDNRDTGVDGSWVFFTGKNYSDAVQLRFPRTGKYVIPLGTFSYKGVYYELPEYDPAKNFNGGLVTNEANPGGDEINGGTVNIAKDGDNYSITFDVTTAKGSLKGSFTGKLKQI